LVENQKYVIHIGAKEKQVPLAFIYDITIEDNEISHMGLSGIGVSWFDRSPGFTAAGTGEKSEKSPAAPVENLIIRQNHIFNCLQNPYNTYEADAKKIGLGGISLGMCEDVIIFGNRIENNGINHLYPACGIFIYRGQFVDISHNLVVNNGPLSGGHFSDDLEKGIRGGIFMRVSVPSKTVEIPDGETLISYDKPAARVHDNVVDQPAGTALTIIVLGPLSILNNRFNSELSDPEDGIFKVGTVKIINKGQHYPGISSVSGFEIANPKYLSLPVYIETSIGKQMPKGNILFNNNQTRMGPENNSHISQVIISRDDIGFDGNQSDALGKGNTVYSISAPAAGVPPTTYVLAINTILKAPTLRATGNRFKEGIYSQTDSPPTIISLITYTKFLNNTVNNQGDHCIFAKGKQQDKVFDEFNQVLIVSECEKIFPVINNLFPSIINELLKDIYKVSGDIETEPTGALELERRFHVTMTSFLEKEMKRLEIKYGTAHPRTRSIETKLTYNINMVRHFDVELQVADIKEPEVKKNEMLIHGRLTDKHLLGIKGISIYLTDRKGAKLTELGTPETDPSGYYYFLVYHEEIQKMKNRKVFLTVCDAKGKTIYRHPESLKISDPGKKYVDMILDREILRPVKKVVKEPIKREEKIEKEKIEIAEEEKAPEEIKEVPSIKLEDIKGIVKASAKKLRDAGIEDVKTFSETEDGKLKEILGNVDIGKMKKESISLLKKKKEDISKSKGE
jgi:hypothetical protein